MVSIEYMVQVMQAFNNGEAIESSIFDWDKDAWIIDDNPVWDWKNRKYRIQKAITFVPFDYTDNLLGKQIEYKEATYGRAVIIGQENDAVFIYDGSKWCYDELLNENCCVPIEMLYDNELCVNYGIKYGYKEFCETFTRLDGTKFEKEVVNG